jgi:ribosomal protein L11 methyltransferase
VTVPAESLEEARARLLELHPEGFEETESALVAYTDGRGEEEIRAAFAEVSAEPVEPGWEERWRDFHRPFWLGPLWVGPPWEQPPSEGISIRIDPGRAFGTGSHPTTRLCLQLLLERDAGSLLDVGCGSGVLSVAAAKLGFGPVIALDIEVAAVDAAARNARTNEVQIDIRHANALVEPLPVTDVTVANINLASVEALGGRLDTRELLTSGYFHARMPRIAGFAHRERRVDGGWAADVFEPQ